MDQAGYSFFLKPKKPPFVVNYNFIKGAFVEVLSDTPGKFLVEFINADTNELVESYEIKNNSSALTKIKYFIRYYIKVTNLNDNNVVFEHTYNAKGKRVFVYLESRALGDHIAWIPQIEEFRKRHQCHLILASYMNELFAPAFPNIEFVEPASTIKNTYAMYGIGLYYDNQCDKYEDDIDYSRNRSDYRQYSIAKIPCEILGIPYQAKKPKLVFKKRRNVYGRYVCIAPHASDLMKYWHYPGGWQQIIDFLNQAGYKVVLISKEKHGIDQFDKRLGGKLRGVIDKTGSFSLKQRASDIANADLFIGVGSGLSWLAWAVGCKVVLISGFSKPYAEFEDCERISTPNPQKNCNGCFNEIRLDYSRPGWCPHFDGTKRMYECSKKITPKMVINGIKRQLDNYYKSSWLKRKVRALMRA